MRFAEPDILYALWGIVLIVLFFIWAERRRLRILSRFVASPLADEVVANFSEQKNRWKNILLALVYVFGILALSRPQWGFEWQKIQREGVDVIFTIDVSKSMLAQDIKPSRLERTKLAVKDFLKKLGGDRVGLVAFAGQAFLMCPLTVDYNGFILSLEDLSVDSIPRGGTNLAEALKESIREYDQTPAKYKAVVVLTDGESLEGDPLAVARQAKAKGIKIYCVGIGTTEGELIQLKNSAATGQFLKDENGNFIKSSLNEKLLQQIALETGGAYIRAGGVDFGLDVLYEREISKMEKRDFEQKMEKRYFERFQIPLAFAIIFLVIETTMTNRRKKS